MVIDQTATFKLSRPGYGSFTLMSFTDRQGFFGDVNTNGITLLVLTRSEQRLEFWQNQDGDGFINIHPKQSRQHGQEFIFDVGPEIVNAMAFESDGDFILQIRSYNDALPLKTFRVDLVDMPEAAVSVATEKPTRKAARTTESFTPGTAKAADFVAAEKQAPQKPVYQSKYSAGPTAASAASQAATPSRSYGPLIGKIIGIVLLIALIIIGAQFFLKSCNSIDGVDLGSDGSGAPAAHSNQAPAAPATGTPLQDPEPLQPNMPLEPKAEAEPVPEEEAKPEEEATAEEPVEEAKPEEEAKAEDPVEEAKPEAEDAVEETPAEEPKAEKPAVEPAPVEQKTEKETVIVQQPAAQQPVVLTAKDLCRFTGRSESDREILSSCLKAKPTATEMNDFVRDALQTKHCEVALRLLRSYGRNDAKSYYAWVLYKFSDPTSSYFTDCIKKSASEAKYWKDRQLQDPAFDKNAADSLVNSL